jgi:hypothetical protein
MKKVTWEIRLWHGATNSGFERWITSNEPTYLPNGGLQFTYADGLERFIIGSNRSRKTRLNKHSFYKHCTNMIF